MRDLIVTENVTLDGVIDAADGWFAPSGSDPGETGDLTEASRAQRATADAVLLGRTTYQNFADYWPHVTDDPTGVADYLDRTAKYVVSRAPGGARPRPEAPVPVRRRAAALPATTRVRPIFGGAYRRHIGNRIRAGNTALS